ncbi:MAG: rhomboid family intramembrane serine protease [Candidatus Aenigmatarchaeota archaeon]|nr:rhomboid family intramembrane serine protease [Candidatus Aenigmarchaeota archaeon]
MLPNIKISLTLTLIIIFTLVFIYEIYIVYTKGSYALELFFINYGFSGYSFLSGKWWTIFTNIFLHGGLDHFIFNMIALFFFGNIIEENLGKKKFLLIFILSAIFGNITVLAAQYFRFMPWNVPTIGASAGIFGLLGTAMLIKPLEFISFPYIIPVPVILVALLYSFYNVMNFIIVISTGIKSEIAYIAHIGGIFIGILFGFKEEGAAGGLKSLLLILAILILIPFVWKILMMLEVFNWLNFLHEFIK